MPMLPRIRRGARHAKHPHAAVPREPRIDVVENGQLRWLNIEQPTALDLRSLADDFGFSFHELDYEDVLSRRQRPKVDEYPEYLFVVLHFPRYDKTVGRLNTAELDIFLGADFLITLPNDGLRPLSRIFHQCESDESFRNEQFGKGPGYLLYRIVSDLFDYCFPILDKIGHKLDEIEDGIFEGRTKQMVHQLSNVKQEIIAYRKIIKPELTTLRVLEMKASTRYLPGSLEVYFDDVIDAGQRVWDILENYKEVVEALEDTNETLIQHRLNDILLVLTMLSATILPLTLISGVYGMNFEWMPFLHDTHGFWIIMGMMVATALGLVVFFRYRKWF